MRGSYLGGGGLNICVGQEEREGADQILGRVQDRRTGEGTDLISARCMT